ncbi:glycoside hydrolase family 15 protein [Zooshikella ganghwensis]|uniref:glycoside hydrolase family 15 protein n=1 Tax=Zooshikella ganghwensis TaxID=202772 RepID=UPI000A07A481|nr:glycoside hydrolase family 15 protein [Zooshikella ganghwensis]
MMKSLKKKALTLVIASITTSLAWSNSGVAPGAPGIDHHWSSASKTGIGTANSKQSKVWFSLVDGIVSEVYWPQIDMAQITDLQFMVSDGKTFFDEEKKHTEHEIRSLNKKTLAFEQVNIDRERKYEISKKIVTDPTTNSLLLKVTFKAYEDNLGLFILLNPAVSNTGLYDYAEATKDTLFAWDDRAKYDNGTNHVAQYQALTASIPFKRTSAGFVGKSDGWQDLNDNYRMDWNYRYANNGNVALTGQLDLPSKAGEYTFTVAIGFAEDKAKAQQTANNSLKKSFDTALSLYNQQWNNYCNGLEDLSSESFDNGALYYASAMVLKAHEDKTYNGAMIASLSVPWGQSQFDKDSGDQRGILPGSSADGYKDGPIGYHVVWPRDLYQVATAFLAAGDQHTAKEALSYLKEVQFKAEDGNWQLCGNSVSKKGSFPQNFWLSGQAHWQGMQLDETAMPIVLAWRLWKEGVISPASYYSSFVKPAADFVAKVGPWTDQERWEEASGISPSTISAAIAGLIAAADFADHQGDKEAARSYRLKADLWADGIADWSFTHQGELGDGQYYQRTEGAEYCQSSYNPDDDSILYIANGGGQHLERNVMDGGFIELVRFGVKSPFDTSITKTLENYEQAIKVETPNGPVFYRYNHDGYGEKLGGSDYTGQGKGRLWPLLTGERAHLEIAKKQNVDRYIHAMEKFANEGNMLPEQVWDKTEGPYQFGEGTGGATPLAWSHAEYIKLLKSKREQRIIDTPDIVAERYQGCMTTVNVHYDAGWGNSIAIRGEAELLNWKEGAPARWTEGNVWRLTLPQQTSSFKMKALINDKTWQKQENFTVKPCKDNHFWPRF